MLAEITAANAAFKLIKTALSNGKELYDCYMVYAGRAEMYSDWLNFQSECKRERERVARLAVLKRHATLKLIKQFVTVIGIAVAVIPIMIYVVILTAQEYK